MKGKSVLKAVILTLVLSCASFLVASTISINNWLYIGPVPVHAPALCERSHNQIIKELLQFPQLEIKPFEPENHRIKIVAGDKKLLWKPINFSSSSLEVPSSFALYYFGAYITTPRWVKGRLVIKSFYPFKAFLDGEEIISQKAVKENSAIGKKEVVLETGKHSLILKVLYDPKINKLIKIEAKLELSDKFRGSNLKLSLSPVRPIGIRELLNLPYPGSVSVSPDGQLFAVTLSYREEKSGKIISWIEIRRNEDGTLYRSFKGIGAISQFRWRPGRKAFSVVKREKGVASLLLVDLEKEEIKFLLRNLKNLGTYHWAPTGEFIVYSVTERKEDFKDGVKQILNLPDRRKGSRNRSYLYLLYPEGGFKERITAGKLTTSFSAFSPDGKKLIFTRTLVDYSARPYSKTEVYCLDFESRQIKKLFTERWFDGIEWSPDGGKLLVLGGPSAFNRLGSVVPKNKIPNDYDTQAYIYDLIKSKVEPITRKFNPSIASAYWSKLDNAIYFVTVDKSFRTLYKYDVKRKTFEKLPTGVEMVKSISFAESKPVAVFVGAGTTSPPRVYRLDLQKEKTQLVFDPNKTIFEKIKFGKVKDFNFKNKRGETIIGRVYYPPDFDPSRKYPCIVYYYGGTTPTSRDFGGRYPKNWWAANGYVVYVLQPSGAIGFGQKFSSYHVNDWGKIVSEEIITGVKKFLKAHPFVDPSRVGAIGASYGGFMTQYLLTRTDIFAAAVSHAGISSISSYWGEGYWGYAYSAIATANSFPWNRKDIYVDRSPLFNAHRIKTPLLLLHGTADTNVPPGESDQLYTALKLLRRPVELIKFKGENHFILGYKKRIIWYKTIIAWFDRWLKDQPEWWFHMYQKTEQ